MSLRRCNAKCYNARGPDCNCLCNGVNHGVGEQQARENSRKIGLIWKAPTHHSRPRRNRRVVVPEQGHLFAINPGPIVVTELTHQIHNTDQEHK